MPRTTPGRSEPVDAADEPAAASDAPDAFSPDDFSAAVSAVTNAFGDSTRREIYLFARDTDAGVTAAEVADAFSLHANVARHHLEKLAAGGYLVVHLARGESAGRPSKRYQAVDNDRLLTFTPRRDALVGTLLARALERLDADDARELAENVGFEYGQWLADQMAPAERQRSQKAAMSAVADALTAHGFAAHAEAVGSELTIVNEHCAFGAAAQQYPHVLCAVDRGMIRGMLAGLYGECDPQFVERRPDGADHCVAHVVST